MFVILTNHSASRHGTTKAPPPWRTLASGWPNTLCRGESETNGPIRDFLCLCTEVWNIGGIWLAVTHKLLLWLAHQGNEASGGCTRSEGCCRGNQDAAATRAAQEPEGENIYIHKYYFITYTQISPHYIYTNITSSYIHKYYFSIYTQLLLHYIQLRLYIKHIKY